MAAAATPRPSAAHLLLRWARLNYGGKNQRWHVIVGEDPWSICGRQDFNYPRKEFCAWPKTGKLCRLCVEKLGRVA